MMRTPTTEPTGDAEWYRAYYLNQALEMVQAEQELQDAIARDGVLHGTRVA